MRKVLETIAKRKRGSGSGRSRTKRRIMENYQQAFGRMNRGKNGSENILGFCERMIKCGIMVEIANILLLRELITFMMVLGNIWELLVRLKVNV